MLNGYGAGPTLPAYGPAVLRIVVGGIFLAHGAQKLFGLFGGGGLDGTTAYFSKLGLAPAYPLALAVGIVEFAGGFLLVAGAMTLVASAALVVNMLVAIVKVHAANGFFAAANGYEFNLTLIGALICLMLTGPGVFSIDGRRAESAAAMAVGRARLRAGRF